MDSDESRTVVIDRSSWRVIAPKARIKSPTSSWRWVLASTRRLPPATEPATSTARANSAMILFCISHDIKTATLPTASANKARVRLMVRTLSVDSLIMASVVLSMRAVMPPDTLLNSLNNTSLRSNAAMLVLGSSSAERMASSISFAYLSISAVAVLTSLCCASLEPGLVASPSITRLALASCCAKSARAALTLPSPMAAIWATVR